MGFGGVPLYASLADKAMIASRSLFKVRRAGDLNNQTPILLDVVDEIDVTVLRDELFGLNHNMFAGTRSLINDGHL